MSAAAVDTAAAAAAAATGAAATGAAAAVGPGTDQPEALYATLPVSSPLTRWMFAEHRCSAAPFTHLIIGGGKFRLPPEQEDEFLRRYALDLRRGHHHYFVEQRTEVFRMLADVDADDDHEWQHDEVVSFAQAWQHVVALLFPLLSGHQRRVVILTTVNKRDKSGALKTGVHLVWPELWVTAADAYTLSDVVVQHLERERPRPPPRKPWREVIDDCVYKGNGLRMAGAFKHARCKACGGRGMAHGASAHGVACPRCLGRKNLEERDRFYWPSCVLDGDGQPWPAAQLDAWAQDLPVLIADTSIRDTTRARTALALAPLPPWYSEAGSSEAGSGGAGSGALARFLVPRASGVAAAVSRGPAGGQSSGQGSPRQVPLGSARFQIVSNEIQRLPPYRLCRIMKIFECETRDGSGPLLVIQTNSRYCLNKGGEHASEHVYFWMFPDQIRQRCHCKCVVKRNSGVECAQFKSAPWPLSPAVSQAVFGSAPGSAPTGSGSSLKKRSHRQMLGQEADSSEDSSVAEKE